MPPPAVRFRSHAVPGRYLQTEGERESVILDNFCRGLRGDLLDRAGIRSKRHIAERRGGYAVSLAQWKEGCRQPQLR